MGGGARESGRVGVAGFVGGDWFGRGQVVTFAGEVGARGVQGGGVVVVGGFPGCVWVFGGVDGDGV